MVEERRNPDTTIRSSSPYDDVASQSCDSRGNVNKKFTVEKSCKCFKAKDFWKIYGSVIVKWCHVKSSSVNSPPSWHPPTTHFSSSSSSTASYDGNKPDFEEAEPSSSRVEEAENPNRISKQKSKEKDEFLRTITSPLSRIVSRISPSSSPRSKSVSQVSSFVSRCMSSRKTASADRDHTNDHDQQQYSNSPSPVYSLSREASQRGASTPTTTTTTPRNVAFSRNASQRSTTQIMFSNSTGRRVKPPTVQKNLECTLEELFFGCTKKVKVTRDVLTDRGQIVQEEEILSIQVKPGWKRGTKITFEEMGNERLGAQPADVNFVIVEKGHPLFRREGDDLELTIEIPLVQALTGCDISIPLMGNSGETMNLMIQDIIYPGYQKIISGKGMPKSKEEEEEGGRGDLRVLFLVEFPTKLTEEQRSEFVSILEGSS